MKDGAAALGQGGFRSSVATLRFRRFAKENTALLLEIFTDKGLGTLVKR